MTSSITFQVNCEDVVNNETLCIVGNIPALGSWSPKGLHLMRQCSTNSLRWTLTIDVPCETSIDYRYAVCEFLCPGDPQSGLVVNRWETNLTPRRIQAEGTTCNTDVDVFGSYGGHTSMEKGWLIGTREIRLTFPETQLASITASAQSCPYSMKITAMDISDSSPIPVLVRNHSFEDYTPRQQGIHGDMITSNSEIITFSTYNLPAGHDVNFNLTLYSNSEIVNNSSNQMKDNGLQLIGQCDFGSSSFSNSVGTVRVSILRDGGGIIVPVNYTVIEPLESSEDFNIEEHFNMEVSYTTYWNRIRNRRSLNVGHRGMGRSLKSASLTKDEAELVSVPENTILSFKEAAKHGADFVEFDVHVTQDGIPVLYHDFEASLSLMEPGANGRTNIAHLALKDLTFDQLSVLRKLTPVILPDGSGTSEFLCEYSQPREEDALPFNKLQTALETVPEFLGFDIEIKYPMEYENTGCEIHGVPMDMNTMVDAILKVVLKYGGKRRIVFSAFHPDVCAMIRMKQPKYPVILCNYGRTDLYESYSDPRNVSVKRSILTALSNQILGLSGHCEDYLKDPSLVKTCHENGLALFTWGEGAIDPGTREKLAEIGIDGIIHDRIADLPRGHKNIFVQEEEEQRN